MAIKFTNETANSLDNTILVASHGFSVANDVPSVEAIRAKYQRLMNNLRGPKRINIKVKLK